MVEIKNTYWTISCKCIWKLRWNGWNSKTQNLPKLIQEETKNVNYLLIIKVIELVPEISHKENMRPNEFSQHLINKQVLHNFFQIIEGKKKVMNSKDLKLVEKCW